MRKNKTIEATKSAIIVKKGLFCQKLPRISKKLVSVSAIFVPINSDDMEIVIKVLYIYYLVQFQKKLNKALLNSSSEVNAINPDYVQKLELKIRKTNIRAQKIDGSDLKTFGIVFTDFLVEDKASRPRFFQEIFLVANTKFEMILGMSFLKINNADVLLGKKTLMLKTYTTSKALSTIEQV